MPLHRSVREWDRIMQDMDDSGNENEPHSIQNDDEEDSACTSQIDEEEDSTRTTQSDDDDATCTIQSTSDAEYRENASFQVYFNSQQTGRRDKNQNLYAQCAIEWMAAFRIGNWYRKLKLT